MSVKERTNKRFGFYTALSDQSDIDEENKIEEYKEVDKKYKGPPKSGEKEKEYKDLSTCGKEESGKEHKEYKDTPDMGEVDKKYKGPPKSGEKEKEYKDLSESGKEDIKNKNTPNIGEKNKKTEEERDTSMSDEDITESSTEISTDLSDTEELQKGIKRKKNKGKNSRKQLKKEDSCKYSESEEENNTDTERKMSIKAEKIKEKMMLRKRTCIAKKSDRRRYWTATNNVTQKENQSEEEMPSAEERDKIDKLAIRLQINGITIREEEDMRVHPSRKENIKNQRDRDDQVERSTIKKLLAPSTQRRIKDWNHEQWSTLQVASIESELPKEDTERKSDDKSDTDVKPILYVKMKGVWAKVYVDQGAQVTVISQDFVLGNEIRRTNIHKPVKLQMANGIIEPAFQMVHNVSIVIEEFHQKINAFVAPIKNYDAILGRDTLSKWGAIIDLRTEKDRLEEDKSKTCGERSPGLSVFDKPKDTRVNLEYCKKPSKLQTLEQACISEEKFIQEMEKSQEFFIYEISVKEMENTNTENADGKMNKALNKEKEESVTQSEEQLREEKIKEEYKDILG